MSVEKKDASRCRRADAPPLRSITLIVLAITLVPVLWAVANHALHTAQMHIYASNITAPGNSSFPLTLEGQVSNRFSHRTEAGFVENDCIDSVSGGSRTGSICFRDQRMAEQAQSGVFDTTRAVLLTRRSTLFTGQEDRYLPRSPLLPQAC